MRFRTRTLLFLVPIAALVFAAGAFADSVTTDFESFSLGSVNGQQGWVETNATHDQAVVASGIDGQSLRISDAVASGGFDWIYAKPLTNGAGEADATGTVDYPTNDRQTHFEAEFDIATTSPDVQPGLHLGVAPDRGDGSRMSYLQFEDTIEGIDVEFYDVQGTSNPANFVHTQIATDLDRSESHHIKFVMDMVDGPSNDVVEIYIDGQLVHTGTSWENYYRYDSEAGPEQTPRIIKTLLFIARGNSIPGDAGNGFLIDNVNLSSSEPASAEQGTIKLRKIVIGAPGAGCFDILVDSDSNCLSNAGTMDVQVTAGSHTVSEDASGYVGSIFCLNGGRVVAASALPRANPSVDVDVLADDTISCYIYNFPAPQR